MKEDFKAFLWFVVLATIVLTVATAFASAIFRGQF